MIRIMHVKGRATGLRHAESGILTAFNSGNFNPSPPPPPPNSSHQSDLERGHFAWTEKERNGKKDADVGEKE